MRKKGKHAEQQTKYRKRTLKIIQEPDQHDAEGGKKNQAIRYDQRGLVSNYLLIILQRLKQKLSVKKIAKNINS